MEEINLKMLLYLIVFGALIIYVIYRVNNKFKKDDVPFGANVEFGLVALLVVLAVLIIHIVFKN